MVFTFVLFFRFPGLLCDALPNLQLTPNSIKPINVKRNYAAAIRATASASSGSSWLDEELWAAFNPEEFWDYVFNKDQY